MIEHRGFGEGHQVMCGCRSKQLWNQRDMRPIPALLLLTVGLCGSCLICLTLRVRRKWDIIFTSQVVRIKEGNYSTQPSVRQRSADVTSKVEQTWKTFSQPKSFYCGSSCLLGSKFPVIGGVQVGLSLSVWEATGGEFEPETSEVF